MAIDGNIYGTSLASSGLHCFGNPNGLSQEVCFDAYAIDLNGRYSFKGLPQLVPYDPVTNKPEVTKAYIVLDNPFSAVLNLKFYVKGQFTIELYNLTGTRVLNKEVEIKKVNDVKSLNTRNLTDGPYVLTVRDQDHNNEEWSETIIKH